MAGWVDVLGGLIDRHRRLWTRLGDLETRLIAGELAAVAVDPPIYVSGLARSGSTILLEAAGPARADRHPPLQRLPAGLHALFWNWFLERAPQRERSAGRAHPRDGSQITPESPEAFEEVLWMAFFPQLHDPAASAVLDEGTSHPGFEALLPRPHPQAARVRAGRALSRQGQLQRHPARVPARDLSRRAFRGAVRDPRLARRLADEAACAVLRGRARGSARGPRICGGSAISSSGSTGGRSTSATRASSGSWTLAAGEEVEGWARYWSHVYGYVAHRLDANARLREAALLVGFEGLRRAPGRGSGPCSSTAGWRHGACARGAGRICASELLPAGVQRRASWSPGPATREQLPCASAVRRRLEAAPVSAPA